MYSDRLACLPDGSSCRDGADPSSEQCIPSLKFSEGHVNCSKRTMSVNNDQIVIKGMVFYGRHGVLEEERTLGQKFEVDVTMYIDLTDASANDSLQSTVNYKLVYDNIRHIVTTMQFYLLERLAGEISDTILHIYQSITSVCVNVRKPQVAFEGVLDSVGIEITRSRRPYTEGAIPPSEPFMIEIEKTCVSSQ